MAKDSQWVAKAFAEFDRACTNLAGTLGLGSLAKVDSAWLNWEGEVKEADKALCTAKRNIRIQEQKKHTELAREKMQNLFTIKKEQAHKVINVALAVPNHGTQG